MTRVLLTGGSGFIAAHILEFLLERGHSVVTTVRSQAKAQKIEESHPRAKLDFAYVDDIAREGAFDEAVKSDPPFEAVIHTASPYQLNVKDVKDVKKDLLDPAIIGTTGILKAIKKNAPSVKRVVITSSFASVIDSSKGNRPGYIYTEKDWSSMSLEEAVKDGSNGYRASKTFAEKAAWDFVENENPNFTLATMCPPMVYGPITYYLNSLSALNTSNQRFRNMIQGEYRNEIPPTGVFLWVDVRDVALAHVLASELPAAANKRFLLPAGLYSNRQIAGIIRQHYPQFTDKLPTKETRGGDYPEGGVYGFDNSRAKEVLGLKFRSLEECVVDTVKSLVDAGA